MDGSFAFYLFRFSAHANSYQLNLSIPFLQQFIDRVPLLFFPQVSTSTACDVSLNQQKTPRQERVLNPNPRHRSMGNVLLHSQLEIQRIIIITLLRSRTADHMR
jgi:hypothetical protein